MSILVRRLIFVVSRNCRRMISTVTFEDVKKLVTGSTSNDFCLIDVRRPDEIQSTGQVPCSFNIPSMLGATAFHNMRLFTSFFVVADLPSALGLSDKEFEEKYSVAKPSKQSLLIFTCQMGGRAEMATKLARELGYSNAKCYRGSWQEWSNRYK